LFIISVVVVIVVVVLLFSQTVFVSYQKLLNMQGKWSTLLWQSSVSFSL